jgi:hypothetical protein
LSNTVLHSLCNCAVSIGNIPYIHDGMSNYRVVLNIESSLIIKEKRELKLIFAPPFLRKNNVGILNPQSEEDCNS